MPSPPSLEREDDRKKPSSIVYTILIFLTCISDGLSTISSSTLLDIADQTHSTTSSVSVGFTVYTTAYSIGSPIFAWILSRFNRQVVIAVNLVIISLAFISVPFVGSVFAYWTTQAVTGMCIAGILIGLMAWLCEMWGSERVNPFMQGVYMSLTSGMMVSSLIAAPFLSHATPEATANTTNVIIPTKSVNDSLIVIPYSICAAICLTMALAHVVTRVWMPYEILYQDLDEDPGFPEATDQRTPDERRSMQDMVLGCLMIACLEGASYSLGAYLPSYSVFCDLKLSKKDGAFMSSLMAGASFVALFVAALIATQVKSGKMLNIGCAVYLAGNISLFFASMYSPGALVFAVVLLGVGNSTLAPNAISFLSSKMTLTSAMFGFITFTKSAGRSLAAYVTGIWIEDHPSVLIYTNLVCLLISVSIILFFHYKK